MQYGFGTFHCPRSCTWWGSHAWRGVKGKHRVRLAHAIKKDSSFSKLILQVLILTLTKIIRKTCVVLFGVENFTWSFADGIEGLCAFNLDNDFDELFRNVEIGNSRDAAIYNCVHYRRSHRPRNYTGCRSDGRKWKGGTAKLVPWSDPGLIVHKQQRLLGKY